MATLPERCLYCLSVPTLGLYASVFQMAGESAFPEGPGDILQATRRLQPDIHTDMIVSVCWLLCITLEFRILDAFGMLPLLKCFNTLASKLDEQNMYAYNKPILLVLIGHVSFEPSGRFQFEEIER